MKFVFNSLVLKKCFLTTKLILSFLVSSAQHWCPTGDPPSPNITMFFLCSFSLNKFMFCFKYSPVLIKRDESFCFQKNMNFKSMIVVSSILMGSVLPIPFLVNLIEWSPPPLAVFLYAYWGGVPFLGIKSK